jgi:hypothetical protein
MRKNSTPYKIKAQLALHDVSDMDVVKALIATHDGLFNNPAYAKPPVDLATYKASIDQFSALIVDAEDGGKKAISARNKQRVVVIKMYTQLGHYVEAACNDDLATFNTSGFTARRQTKTPPQPLTGVKFAWIDRGANSGQIVVKPKAQARVIAYDMRYAQVGNGGALGSWTTLTLTDSTKVTVNGLTPAGIYQFQIRALGKLGYTDWSESLTFICA